MIAQTKYKLFLPLDAQAKAKQNLSFNFIFNTFFKSYYCSINLKRQSEHSGLCPDTSSLVSIFEFSHSLKNLRIAASPLCYSEHFFLDIWLAG